MNLISRLINRSGLRISHSKVFSSGGFQRQNILAGFQPQNIPAGFQPQNIPAGFQPENIPAAKDNYGLINKSFDLRTFPLLRSL